MNQHRYLTTNKFGKKKFRSYFVFIILVLILSSSAHFDNIPIISLFVLFLVITGATDGIGKEYARSVSFNLNTIAFVILKFNYLIHLHLKL